MSTWNVQFLGSHAAKINIEADDWRVDDHDFVCFLRFNEEHHANITVLAIPAELNPIVMLVELK